MADTRCVNAEYQLDVDVMILEHLLYHAIRAQFNALKPNFDKQAHEQNDERSWEDKEQIAERSLHALYCGRILSSSTSILADEDCLAFIEIFKRHHNDYAYSGGTSFCLTILEITILLSMRPGPSNDEPLINGSSSPTVSATISVCKQWLGEQPKFVEDRRRWLKHRERLGRVNDLGLPTRKDDILDEIAISSWAAFQQAHVTPRRSDSVAPLFVVLHRFMLLSSIIAPEVGDINRKWMELALQLMFQSALEVLSFPEQLEDPRIADGQHTTNGHLPQVPGLIECFAFGYLPTLTSSNSISETEHAINTLFASSSPASADPAENTDWTKLRSESLAQFCLPDSTANADFNAQSTRTAPLIDPKAYHARVARLKHKYPFDEVEAKLLQCLEHFWILNCSEEVSGKPVLVQIEEGRLEGLNEKEFDDFIVRVGLQRDEKGMLSFKAFKSDNDQEKEAKVKT